jgi:adenylate kinase family enzyme
LKFNRFTCYFQALKRAFKYRKIQRESAPEGCREKFSFSFQWWILFAGRTRKRNKFFSKTINKYSHKIIILKNRKDVMGYLNKN